MSFLDISNLSKRGLIVHYVLECRASGHVLPYDDYAIIDQWLTACPSTDDLLLILADIIPPFFERKTTQSRPKPLRLVNKKVLRKIKEKALHGMGA